jgi:hypothetical protein
MREFLGRVFFYVVAPVIVLGIAALTAKLVFFAPLPRQQAADDAAAVADAEKKPSEEPLIPEVNMKNPEISHVVDGVVRWTVRSKSVKSDTKTGLAKMIGSEGVFVRSGDKGLEFNAPETVYDTKKKRVRAQGGVDGRLIPEDSGIHADDISWEGSTGIVTASAVKIDMGSVKVSGNKMEIAPGEKTVKITGNVRIEIKLDRKGPKSGTDVRKTSGT